MKFKGCAGVARGRGVGEMGKNIDCTCGGPELIAQHLNGNEDGGSQILLHSGNCTIKKSFKIFTFVYSFICVCVCVPCARNQRPLTEVGSLPPCGF